MSTQKTKVLSIFIDMRNSTDIENKKIYLDFYNPFRGLKKDEINGKKLNNSSLYYKVFIGDAVFLLYKKNSLGEDGDVETILKEIQKMVEDIEEKTDLKYGIGISYGLFENIEGGTDDNNKAIPLSKYIDHAAKVSSLPMKTSDDKFRFALRLLNKNGELKTNKDLRDHINDFESSITKTGASKKIFRFYFEI